LDSDVSIPEFSVRMATVADLQAIATHRCEMFRDMGQLQDDAYDALAESTMHYLEGAMPRGEYVAWLVYLEEDPGKIVAGGGVQLRSTLPRPTRDGRLQPPGRQALIVNVYTEPEWRRRGLAELVMRSILEWCRAEGLPSVVLHASEMGRPLYERLGFLPTNEMYFPVQDR
jgi:GNAT superfamily N-acetyltransferase